jgi:hypothetical protein
MHVSTTMKASCGIALVCVIAILAGSAHAARPTSDTFAVTLHATVTKDWNTAIESTENGCTVVRRSIGHRTVTLRSTRPTTVVVRLRSGKVSFSPSAVRFVTARITQSGENRTRKGQPCGSGTQRVRCRPSTRHVSLGAVHFFRSRRNELTFRPTTLPGAGTACPRESAPVRAIRPGLRDAAGQIAEVELAGGAAQTAFASAAVTTNLEGAETGRVVERVRWSMTFARP